VVERLVAVLGRVDGNAQVVLKLLLADELVKPPGAQRDIQLLFVVLELAGGDALGRRTGAPCDPSAEGLCYLGRLYVRPRRESTRR
jgi:hypothetical protein